MKQQHPWAGKAHNLFYTLTHIGLITMNRTRSASRLLFTESAMIQPLHCISIQSKALIAQP